MKERVHPLSIAVRTALCTAALCSGTLYLLQDPSLHPRRLYREMGSPQQLSSLKFRNERGYIHCCTYGALYRGTLQRAPSTLCRIHRCTFYHVYRRTRLFRGAALNGKFLDQRARRKSFLPIRRNPSARKDFSPNAIISEKYN